MVPTSVLTLSVVLYSSLIQSLPQWPPSARFGLLRDLCIVCSSAGARCSLLSTSFPRSLSPGLHHPADLYSIPLTGLMFSPILPFFQLTSEQRNSSGEAGLFLGFSKCCIPERLPVRSTGRQMEVSGRQLDMGKPGVETG